MIHPAGDILHIVVHALTSDGIYQHRAFYIHTAEQADGFIHPRADPIRRAGFVNLKIRRGKHIGRILEAQMAHQITVEVFGCGVFDALFQALHRHFLRCHIDNQIRRKTFGPIVEPLDNIAVHQACHADRFSLVIDLGIVVLHFKLADHVAQFTQLPGTQTGGAVAIQHRDLIEAQLIHFFGKIPRFNGQQLLVGIRPQDHGREDASHQRNHNQRSHDIKRDAALFAHKVEISFGPVPLKACGHHSADAVNRAEQEYERIKFRRFQVDWRQYHIKINQSEHNRHQQIGQRTPHRRLDGLGSFLFALLGLVVLLRSRRTAEIKPAKRSARTKRAAAKSSGVKVNFHCCSSLSVSIGFFLHCLVVYGKTGKITSICRIFVPPLAQRRRRK